MRNMLFLRQNPFIRITLIHMAGILYADLFSIKLDLSLLLAAIISTFLISLVIMIKHPGMKKYLSGSVIFIILASSGAINYALTNRHADLPAANACYAALVTKQPAFRSSVLRIDCLLTEIRTAGDAGRLTEKTRLYLRPDSLMTAPRVGDRLEFMARMQPVSNRGNPGEFDFAHYMERQGIKYTAFLKADELHDLGFSGRRRIRRFTGTIQEKMIASLVKYGIRDDELGVVSALVAGERDLLDEETRTSYAGAGAMHVLAVSGLHVGILYLFLSLFFRNRKNKHFYRFFRLFVMLSCLWFYALITGLSTSVLRATIMFSLFLLGSSFERKAGIYNLLAASAMIVLLIDPNQLFSLGFQYSYLAVLGILFFQPRLENILTCRRAVTDRIWQLFTVGIAAQLTTFPLSLFIFNRFPVYFWLTNLLIIPMVWLIMMFAVVFFLVLPVPFLAAAIASILNVLLKINNQIVSWISKLPFAVAEHIRFEDHHLILTYLLLAFLMILLIRTKYKYMIPVILGFTLVTSVIDLNGIYQRRHEKLLIVYSQKNSHMISIINGENHFFFSLNIDSTDTGNNLTYLENFWISYKIRKNMQWLRMEELSQTQIEARDMNARIYDSHYSIRLDTLRLLYFRKATGTVREKVTEGYTSDHLIVDNMSGLPDPVRLKCYSITKIILAGSLRADMRKAWQNYGLSRGIPVHDLHQEGAFIWKTNRWTDRGT